MVHNATPRPGEDGSSPNMRLESPPLFSSFVDALRSRALECPDRCAFTYLVDGESAEVHLTYGELDRRARALARHLLTLATPGERALLFCPQGLDFVVAWFGCVYAGLIAVPAYPPKRGRTLGRLVSMLSDCDARVALTTSDVMDDARRLFAEDAKAGRLQWVAADNALPDPGDWTPASPGPDSIAFLQYTSGSTASPKGVMVSHSNLVWNAHYIQCATQADEHSRSVSWLPQFHDMGLIGGILLAVYVKGHGTLMSHVHFLQRPMRWLEAIARQRATHSGAPTFAWKLAVSKLGGADLSNLDLSSWRVAFNSAEPLRADTMDRFLEALAPCGLRRDVFMPCYGLAEATLGVTFHSYGDTFKTLALDSDALKQGRAVPVSPGGGARTVVSSGQSPRGQVIRIVDPEQRRVLPDGAVGEIWVKGPTIARGYWNKPGLTRDTFDARLADTDGGSYLRTGDLGFLLDSELYVTGRLKDLIIIRGANHYPEDIEATVETAHPALRAGCGAVFSIEADGEERLAVVHEIERTHLRDLDAESVALAIRHAVSQYHEIEVYAVVLLKTGSLLKTSSGKIQRRANRDAYLNGTLAIVAKSILELAPELEAAGEEASRPVMPRPWHSFDEIRSAIVSIIARRLNVSSSAIDDHQPFASLGLNSLAAVELAAALEQQLGRALSPTLAFEYPSIDSLARYLAEESAPHERATRHQGEPIAIIGMGCRFPGADGVDAFWQLLKHGVDAISEVPPQRWNIQDVYDPAPATPGKMVTKWGGFVDTIDQFDSAFFGISPREAACMDPQQRLVMEVSWESLEHAGIRPNTLSGTSTGVFVGIGPIDYLQIQIVAGSDNDAYVASGNSQSIAANRLSYSLDLRGPSVAIDTACSSALVAVHQACQSLRHRECDLAMAGGVNAITSPFITVALSQARMMSADGRCKAFDESADGYVRSEGCGIVVLKRLSDALRDGDTVHAVIRGTAVNHDGRSNGLTAPNGQAQQAVMRAALDDAGVLPNEISNLEAHGTGTPVGDPIEFEAFKSVLMDGRGADETCTISSVKTNIGHLEAAAGAAGLIKTVLALQHGQIPPHLHLQKLNPMVRLDQTPFEIPQALRDWPSHAKRRISGVSAFGFGGANAHVVVEAAPAISHEPVVEQPPRDVFVCSARSEEALRALVSRYVSLIDSSSDSALRDVLYSSQVCRMMHEFRFAVATPRLDDPHAKTPLVSALQAYANEGKTSSGAFAGKGAAGKRSKVAFLFTGQGAQFVGMGRHLYESQPRFRATIDRCDSELTPLLGRSIKAIVFGDDPDAKSLLDQTAYTQPALFVLEYALADLWRSWGVVPDLVLGHSVGEIAAACFSGALSLESGLRLIAERGRLIQSLPAGGGMAAVFTKFDRAREVAAPYADRLSVAAVNGPNLCVLSGEKTALEKVLAQFESDGVKVTRMSVSHAFHSPLMSPILDAFREVVSGIEFGPLAYPLASNKLGRVLLPGESFTAEYWTEHIADPVLFEQGMKAAAEYGCTVFLEVGPANTLVGMGKRCIDIKDAAWLTSLSKDADNWQPLLTSVAALYCRGIEADWVALHNGAACRKVPLPTYPFQRSRYWIAPAQDGSPRYAIRALGGSSAVAHPAEGDAAGEVDEATRSWFYRVDWNKAANLNGVHQRDRGRWILIGGDTGFADRLETVLRDQEQEVLRIVPGDEFSVAGTALTMDSARPEHYLRMMQHALADGPVTGIVNLLALDGRADCPVDRASRASVGLLYTLQALLKHGDARRPAPAHVVTRHVHAIDNAPDMEAVFQSGVWGFGRTAGLEHPDLMGKLIDIDGAEQTVAALASELLHNDAESMVALRESGRYVARLVRHEAPATTAVSFRPDGTYLITGGLGSLGFEVARWMVQHGARRFLMLGRTAVPPRSEWSSLAAESKLAGVVERVKTLELLGASVHVMSCDVADLAQLQACVELYEREAWPPVRGVVHAAGVLLDSLLHQMDGQSIARVAAPKVLGAWNLHRAFESRELDFFVMFSSAASLLGSVGQANYAAANAFLDGLAHVRRAAGLPGLSINWGPWADAGMAARPDRGGRLASQGMHSLPPAKAVRAFGVALSQARAQVGVVDADWRELLSHAGNGAAARFLEQIASPVPMVAASDIADRVHAATPEERRPLLISYLRDGLARVLHADPETIATDQNLISLGLDSIMVMDLIRGIERDLKFRVHPREIFDQPTIEGLASYIATELDILQAQRSGEAPPDGGYIRAGFERVRKALASGPRVAPQTKNPPCVFLLSAPRSGSTLLRVMLAGHHRLFSPPELHILHFGRMSNYKKMLLENYRMGEGLQRAVMELRKVDAEGSRRIIDEWIAKDLSIQEVYRIMQQDAGERILVDKSPTYTANPDSLVHAESLFELPKYIYLYRHPYSVIESYVRNRTGKMFDFGHVDPHLLAEEVWTSNNVNVLNFLRDIDPARHYRVQYEELVKSPEQVMRGLCDFLGVPWAAGVLEPYADGRMTDGVHDRSRHVGDPNFHKHEGIDSGLADVWRSIQLPRALGAEAVAVAAELQYELPNEHEGARLAAIAAGSEEIEEERL